MENKTIIEMRNIVKRFYIGQPNELEILHGINLDVKNGEFLSIVGESGSGKSTLMNLIGALDRPTDGSYLLDGMDISRMNDTALSRIRNERVGFVFQSFHLIPRTNALRNVELPLLYAGVPRKKRRERAMEMLEMVGMADRMEHKPNELSGGQKQRIAIARAMIHSPSILLADEPTGALDSKTGRLIMDLFHKLHQEKGTTVILITHNQELAMETDRILTLSDGRIVQETVAGKPVGNTEDPTENVENSTGISHNPTEYVHKSTENTDNSTNNENGFSKQKEKGGARECL